MSSVEELLNLEGRVALITGGGGCLGRVIAEGLTELGAMPVLLDRDEKRSSDVAAKLAAQSGSHVRPMVVDLADEKAVRSVPARIEEEFGRLDVLVHCAALTGDEDLSGYAVPFTEQDSGVWRRALEVNLTAVFNLTQAATPLLRRSPGASVINVASIYGLVGSIPQLYQGTDLQSPAAYAASKGGLLQLTRWLATNLAPEVRVNAVSPGGILRGQPEEFRRRYEGRTPLGRMATEGDVKGAAVFLASDMSRYVTGQNIIVDGGWTVW